MVQVVQGTGSVLTAENRGCVTVYSAGTVFFEQKGNVHHLYNLDPKVPLLIKVTFFIERTIAVTRSDEADPVTGSLTASEPPPAAVCPAP
jgi:quercetin dioxygenase-like cupin family protein